MQFQNDTDVEICILQRTFFVERSTFIIWRMSIKW